jgi:phosphatidylglycerol---prolipoprotein diacylglyceryl transferase
MYPVLFRIGDFEITSFGVLVAVGALVGIWIFRRELKRNGLPDDGVDAAFVGVLGGLIGAKLLWTLEFSREASVTDLLFSRGGLSWFGGLTGGVGAGLWMVRRRRVPVVPALAAATPALAVGHAIGRIGCFMVGDDYGSPSNLPWAVAFPEGLPPTSVRVHPTQLYEAIALAGVAWALIRRRAGVPMLSSWAVSRVGRLNSVRDRVHPGQPSCTRTVDAGASDRPVPHCHRRDDSAHLTVALERIATTSASSAI